MTTLGSVSVTNEDENQSTVGRVGDGTSSAMLHCAGVMDTTGDENVELGRQTIASTVPRDLLKHGVSHVVRICTNKSFAYSILPHS